MSQKSKRERRAERTTKNRGKWSKEARGEKKRGKPRTEGKKGGKKKEKGEGREQAAEPRKEW